MKMNSKKKGQVAVEFLMLIVIAFTIFIVYTAVTMDNVIDIIKEEEYIMLKDTIYAARNEILLASKVEDGYYREFELPQKLGDKYIYNITITGDSMAFNSSNHLSMTNIPIINGTLKKGTNIITKSGGVISLN